MLAPPRAYLGPPDVEGGLPAAWLPAALAAGGGRLVAAP
jgi:hypothetical protein